MKYLEFTFRTVPCTEIVNDVLSGVLGEAGFESFVDKRGGYYVVCQGMYPSLTEVRRAERTLYESGYETRIAPIMEEKS